MTTRSNAEWLSALREGGQNQEMAVQDLRLLLRRATSNFLSRRGSVNVGTIDPGYEDLAEECAQESTLLILSKLD